jgi:predicted GH43/DUF377 family glycosyl hydrolase
MFVKTILPLFLLLSSIDISAGKYDTLLQGTNDIVIETKQIFLPDFPDAYNPTIIKADQGYILAFRYPPDRYNQAWVSYIGVVLLDDNFEPISTPQLVKTRFGASKTPSQSEDPRLFSYRGRIFLIYNDNFENTNPNYWQRRDMFIAELLFTDKRFKISAPLKLIYEEKYNTQFWQKNWIPFEWDGCLLLSYSFIPHEILYANLANGNCYKCYESTAQISWEFGKLRGSTPPLLVDGEYLGFFHSATYIPSMYSWDENLWYYFIGAYTFSAKPPFEVTSYTPQPIIGKGFYTLSNREKRVIFPGGYVVSDSKIYMVYGKDDYEMWIATIDKGALKKALVPVKN